MHARIEGLPEALVDMRGELSSETVTDLETKNDGFKNDGEGANAFIDKVGKAVILSYSKSFGKYESDCEEEN
jgi:hypothetical protein